MEFKSYTHIEFKETFFTFTIENGTKISLPYSKLDIIRQAPASNLMSVVTKGHGSFDKTYEDSHRLEADLFKLMSRGKALTC